MSKANVISNYKNIFALLLSSSKLQCLSCKQKQNVVLPFRMFSINKPFLPNVAYIQKGTSVYPFEVGTNGFSYCSYFRDLKSTLGSRSLTIFKQFQLQNPPLFFPFPAYIPIPSLILLNILHQQLINSFTRFTQVLNGV